MLRESNASSFQRLLFGLSEEPGIAADVFGRVLERVTICSPDQVTQAEIARGAMLARPTSISAATVSRALQVLKKFRLTATQGEATTGGRPRGSWSLDPASLGLLGVHVDHHDGRVVGLTALVMRLDLTPIVELEPFVFDKAPSAQAVGDRIVELAKLAQQAIDGSGRQLLGVGIEIGGHVHDGEVVQAHNAGWDRVNLAQTVADLSGQATVLENDVNARAVLQAYRQNFYERDFVQIGVLDEGVGGALILDGRLHRGAGGVAGELGHLFVNYEGLTTGFDDGAISERRQHPDGFGAICSCGKLGHVETIATPARILGELQVDDLNGVALAPLLDRDDRLTREAQAFRDAGRGLGRALAIVASLVNPARIVLMLPSELASPMAGRAASAYLAAVESALDDDAFSTASNNAHGDDGRLLILPLAQEDIGVSGASAAGAFVLHAFIDALRGRRMVARLPSESRL